MQTLHQPCDKCQIPDTQPGSLSLIAVKNGRAPVIPVFNVDNRQFKHNEHGPLVLQCPTSKINIKYLKRLTLPSNLN